MDVPLDAVANSTGTLRFLLNGNAVACQAQLNLDIFVYEPGVVSGTVATNADVTVALQANDAYQAASISIPMLRPGSMLGVSAVREVPTTGTDCASAVLVGSIVLSYPSATP